MSKPGKVMTVLKQIGEEFQRLPQVFGVAQHAGTSPTYLPKCQKFKIAAYKPEVIITWVIWIATPFQLLPPYFLGRQLKSTIANTARYSRQSVFQISAYFKMAAAKSEVLISASRQDSIETTTARSTSMLSESRKSMPL
jgi:hypothetical protein